MIYTCLDRKIDIKCMLLVKIKVIISEIIIDNLWTCYQF
jgi:hypothetical protein